MCAIAACLNSDIMREDVRAVELLTLRVEVWLGGRHPRSRW